MAAPPRRRASCAHEKRGIACEPAQDQGWGVLTKLQLPGGGKLGVYQPRHARPNPMSAEEARKR